MANQNITITNRYTHKKAKPTVFSKNNDKSVSRTQQHFKDETNINSIMKRYKASGLLTDPLHKPTTYPEFGDFTGIVDFQTMQNKQIQIRDYFMSLPAELRKRFENNPQNLMTFMSDPANVKEARELGLLPRDLSSIKYIRTLEDGSVIDITDEVIANRGLFVDGKRVNRDGTIYVEATAQPVVDPISPEIPTEE